MSHRCDIYPDENGVGVVAELGDGLTASECPQVDFRYDGEVVLHGWSDEVSLGKLSKANMKRLGELLIEGSKRPRGQGRRR